MDISNLIIEVTRKCNISCEHCLRGEPINVHQKKEYIDSLLDQVSYIGTVTFTGGEPTLNVPIMEYFLEQCKVKGVSVDGFYVVTNGIKVPESFVIFCLKMYSFCNEKDLCCVQVSNDEFHDCEGQYNVELLKGLSFFSKKFEKDRYNYNRGTSLIKEGRSNQGCDVYYVEEDSITLDEFDELELSLNCKGEIINGCNWSYKNQSKHKLCDVKDLTKYYQKLVEQEQFEEVE